MGRGTSLGRVRGLGSAHAGPHHWWLQRVTAAANLVLLIWFVVSLARLPVLDHQAVVLWLKSPLAAVPLLLLVVSVFWHLRLGLQVFIEDYVHEEGGKIACLLASQCLCDRGRDAVRLLDPQDRFRWGARLMTASSYKIIDHVYDAVVVGAGGSGLRATMGCAEKGLKTACITKVFPTRSHTVAAQGGIAASPRQQHAGPLDLAHVRHRQGVGLARRPGRHRIYGARGAGGGDRARACRRAVQPQSEKARSTSARSAATCRTWAQGPPVQRTCAAADRTGHAMLHALYQQSLKYDADFYIEYFALDLIMEDGVCKGVCTSSVRISVTWIKRSRAVSSASTRTSSD